MAEAIVDAAVRGLMQECFKQVGYLVHYKKNIKNLKATVEELLVKKDDVERRVEEDRRNLYEIEFEVENWLSSVHFRLEQVRTIIPVADENRIRNINLKSRYEFSRKARKVQPKVAELVRKAQSFLQVDYSRNPPESRSIDIMDDAMKVLMDDRDEVSMVSICGMAGVGKTTFAKQLVEFIQERHVLDGVCMSVVSHSPDLRRIQKELADSLGLKFDVDSLLLRARRLHSKIIDFRRILLILDDVWEEVDLEKIGIPSAGEAKGLKIILTSRSQDVCNRMGSQRNFTIAFLTEDEAWQLFRTTAFEGDPIPNPEMIVLAKQIVVQCGGLPIAIVAIAKALRKKPISAWKDVLEQLRNFNMRGFSNSVFDYLRLSFDHLSEELKSCLLLCCLFPKDSCILIEDLVRYGMRLRLFGNTDSFLQARDRAHSLMDELKQSYLLLEGDTGDSVKMHDRVRDFAKEKSYVCCDDEMNTDTLRSCKAMSLLCEETNKCPVVSQCPNLEFLLFVSRRSSESFNFFFQGMKAGELGNLVVLAIKTQCSPKLPEEIGLLTNLRLLDLGGMSGLKYVPPGVLSKLSTLEELYVTPEYDRWGSRVEGEYGEIIINASLAELESLPITRLEISIPKCEIRLGKESEEDKLVLEGDACNAKGSGVSAVLRKFKELRLVRVENVKSIFELLIDYTKQIPSSPVTQLQYFYNLRCLAMEYCGDLKHLFPLSVGRTLSQLQKIRINDCIKMEGILCGKGEVAVEFLSLTILELISVPNLNGFWVDIDNADAEDASMKPSTSYWKGPSSSMEQPDISEIETESSLVPEIGRVELDFVLFPSWIRLSNLEELRLQGCRLLRVAFPSTVAKQLVKLRTLDIRWCCKMEYIVATVGGAEENDNRRSSTPVFPKLTSFILDDLPELINAFSADSHLYLESISLEELKVSKCPKIKTLFAILPRDYGGHLPVSNNEVLFKIRSDIEVKFLEVRLCDNLTHLFSSCAAKLVKGLKRMEIRYCEKMKEIVRKKKEGEDSLDFPPLEKKSEYERATDFEGESVKTFSDLEEITLFGLENLNHVFTGIPTTTIGFQKLVKLYLHGCHSLRNIFSVSSARGLLQLQELKVSSCNGLKEIVAKNDEEEQASRDRIVFPQLSLIDISCSATLECFYSGSYDLEMPLLESLHLNQCPSAKKFLNASTPKLPKAQRDSKETKISTPLIGDLDEIIAKNKMQKRTQIRIYNRNDFKNIGHDDQLPYGDLSQIQDLEIQACDELLCAIPCNVKTSDLQKLEKLVVRRCDLLKEIFESGSIATFANLEQITLFDLEKLQRVFYDIPKVTIHFQKLKKLHIHGCNSLRNVFSVSIIKCLSQLQALKVSSCDGLEEIVAQGEKEEQATKDEIVFPKLQSIDIGYSSNLVCFYSGIYALEFPLLESLFLYKCTRMSTFSKESVAIPKLQKVQIGNNHYQAVEDLNIIMYKGLIVERGQNSQGLDEQQQDSEFAFRSSAQMYNNTDVSSSSAAHTAALEHEIQILKQQLAAMQQTIANLQQ